MDKKGDQKECRNRDFDEKEFNLKKHHQYKRYGCCYFIHVGYNC